MIYLLLYAIILIFNTETYSNISPIYFENYGMSFADIMVFFVSNVAKYTFKTKSSEKSERQNYLKDFGILFLISAFSKFNDFLPYLLDKLDNVKGKTEDENSRILLVNDVVVLVIITLLTFFILKYKYYIHHIISIIIIVIICISLDFLFSNFKHTNKFTVISSIVFILADSILYSYIKYLIEFKYYFYLDILYIFGIFCFFWNSVSLCIYILVSKLNRTNTIFFEFYDYYNTKGVGYVIFRFFFGLIITGFISDILEFIILDKLTPNYIIILYEMAKIPLNIKTFIEKDYNNHGKLKVLVLIAILVLSIFQAITFLFYLEIFELNFCSLNKNTKKNIEERMLSIDNMNIGNVAADNESDIVIKGYIVKDDIKKNIEMTYAEKNNLENLN